MGGPGIIVVFESSLRKFLDPSVKPKVICTDNSLESGKYCEEPSWNYHGGQNDCQPVFIISTSIPAKNTRTLQKTPEKIPL